MNISYGRRAFNSKKPIDRWLGLVGIAIGVVLFLLPKTPFVVVACCLLIFTLLLHPVWNFWWIEKSISRRCSAIASLAAILFLLGIWTWPVDELTREFCPHPLAFNVRENEDYSVDVTIKKKWFGKPMLAVTIFSRRALQLEKIKAPASASIASGGWSGGIANLGINETGVPMSELRIANPENPEVVCVNQER